MNPSCCITIMCLHWMNKNHKSPSYKNHKNKNKSPSYKHHKHKNKSPSYKNKSPSYKHKIACLQTR